MPFTVTTAEGYQDAKVPFRKLPKEKLAQRDTRPVRYATNAIRPLSLNWGITYLTKTLNYDCRKLEKQKWHRRSRV